MRVMFMINHDFDYIPELAVRIFDRIGGDKKQRIPDAHILRVGDSSIALVTSRHPNAVVKIVKPGKRSFGLSVEEEFDLLRALKSTNQGPYITPMAFAYGTNPDFIVMEHLGKTLEKKPLRFDRAEEVGRGIGEFCATTWNELNKSIHLDLCLRNLTHAPDGRIGIIDIASVKQGGVENMFFKLLMAQPNLSPYLADEFTQRTGVNVDFAVVQQRMHAELTWQVPSMGTEEALRIQSDVASNLAEWRALKESGRLNSHRPQPRRAHSSTPAPKAGT